MAATKSREVDTQSPPPDDSAPNTSVPELKIPTGDEEYEGPAPTPIGDVNVPLVTPGAGVELPEITNGPAQLYPTPPGSHYVRVLTDVTIRIPPYENFRFQMWKNHKIRHQDDIYNAPDYETRCRMLARIILKHYEWHDDEGVLLPAIADDPVAFVNECPPDLYQILMQALREEANRVPDFPTIRR